MDGAPEREVTESQGDPFCSAPHKALSLSPFYRQAALSTSILLKDKLEAGQRPRMLTAV